LTCQHAPCLVIAQPFQYVKLEEFVDDYYSMEKFKKAYKRVVVPLENKSFWAQIDIQVRIRVTLVKRHVGRQRNRFKASLGAQIVESWVIRRIVQNATQWNKEKVMFL
jgi:hypothetical protein